MTNHPNRGALPLPAIMLRELSRRYPSAWKLYDELRQDRGKDGMPDWPEWCYCPMAAAYAIVGNGDSLDGDHASIASVQALSALASWRVGQGIYRFDPTIAQAIIDSPITALPVDVLYRLPEWCVYIEATPGVRYDGNQLAGFFAYLEWDANSSLVELRFLLVCEDGDVIGAALRSAHLDRQTGQTPAESPSGRQLPRPHVRRAHWHTYLVGPGRAETILKWLPPIPINIDTGDIIPTIREVKS